MGEAVDDKGFRLMARLWDRAALATVVAASGSEAVAKPGSDGNESVWANVSSGRAGRGGRALTATSDEALDVSEKVGGGPLGGGGSRAAMVLFIRERHAGVDHR